MDEKILNFVEKFGVIECVFVGLLLKFCLVVEGSVDVYLCFGLMMEWDIGVGYVVFVVVGGWVIMFEGDVFFYVK